METLLQQIGLNSSEFYQIIIVGVLLLVGLGALKLIFKMAASVIKVGCGLVFLIIAGMFLLQVLN